MMIPFIKGAGPSKASTQEKGYTETHGDIGCVEVSTPMSKEAASSLSNEDLKYIRDLLAEGIARMLVEKVTKNTVPAVDSSEPERYNPSPQKEVSS